MCAEDDEVLKLELKYCERCGGLWLRVNGLEEIYCAACAAAMNEVAPGFRSRRKPRLPVNRGLKIDGQSAVPAALYQKGGIA